MSRSGTATPPAAYFPQKVATPSVRHSAPSSSHPHLNKHAGHNKRSRKHVAGPTQKGKSSGLSEQVPMDMSFEDISVNDADLYQSHNQSTASFGTFQSVNSMPGMDHDVTNGTYLAVPNGAASFYTANSATNTPLVTPNQSDLSLSPLQMVSEAEDLIASSCSESQQTPIPTGRATSWTSNIGKMAKAVVHTGKSMGIAFGEKKRKDLVSSEPIVVSHPTVDEVAGPTRTCTPSPEPAEPPVFADDRQGHHLSTLCDPQLEASSTGRREMLVAQHPRIFECARLCSQWPESGYQKSKFGPHGAKAFYEPASVSNPHWVFNVMQRQAELESWIAENSASHFTCRRNYQESCSDDGTDQSVDSYTSSRSSPTSSVQFEAEQKTIAAMKAAMEDQLISAPLDIPARETCSTKKAIRGARSISELDSLANAMRLSVGEDQSMDLELSESGPASDSSRHERAASAGSKRGMQPIGPDEEKRRKVDEAMVVEEAVSSGVIMPAAPPKIDTCQNRQLSSSTPDLSSIKSTPGPAMFGHVVKTSDTHPIIISPFFPAEILPILATNLVTPRAEVDGRMLGSKVDVAALLLAHTPNSSAASSAVSSPIVSNFSPDFERKQKIGNLLLSSCPGKRLRMDGPVKGRPPVCRDLETDLRRIKSEGVGCLVCCLDDAELALLGVPWDTYHSIATKIGLDVIRMPMPDGFTPVSMRMFDQHVGLICQKYTLEGINVLVHCRGGVGRAGLTASAWAIKMGFVSPHPSLQVVADASKDNQQPLPAELEHKVVMSMVERVIAMIRCRRGLKAIESFEQVHFLAAYVAWLRDKATTI